MPKICTKCLQEKDDSAFYWRGTRFDSWCRPCYSENTKAYKRKDPEKVRSKDRAYRLKNKENHQQQDKKYRLENKEDIQRRKRNYRLENPEKIKKQKHDSYERNKEKHQIKTRIYRQNHPEMAYMLQEQRRARKLNAPLNDLTKQQWQEIQVVHDYRCVYCHRKSTRLTMDHIIPLSRAGSHTASNIVPACISCNSKKQAGPPLIPVQPLLLTMAPPKKQRKP
jgi:HNH endonuclease